MEERITEEEFERERHEVEPPLRTREEVAYYRIFAEELGEIRPRRTISRFATAWAGGRRQPTGRTPPRSASGNPPKQVFRLPRLPRFLGAAPSTPEGGVGAPA